jgi:hypothetical protein
MLYLGQFGGRRAEHAEIDPVQPSGCTAGEDHSAALAIRRDRHPQAGLDADRDNGSELMVQRWLASCEVEFVEMDCLSQ